MKLLFKPLNMLISALAGVLAGALFKRVWRGLAGEDEAPEATALEHSTRKVLLSAALHGAVYSGVQAAVARARARGADRLRHPRTHHQP